MIEADDEQLPAHVRSILKLVGSVALANAAKQVPAACWTRSQAEIEKLARPSKVAFDLRRAFWTEIEHVLAGRLSCVQLTNLARRARCSYVHAYQLLTEKPEVLAWLLCPAKDLALDFEVALHGLAERIREIVELPVIDPKGQVILKNAKIQFELFKYLDSRHGYLIR